MRVGVSDPYADSRDGGVIWSFYYEFVRNSWWNFHGTFVA